MAKLLATEVAQEAVDVAIQIHGAQGARARARPRAPLPRGAGAAHLRGRLGDPARDHRPRAVRLPGRGLAMKIAITGGGPGGLYAAILFSRLDAANEVTVWERNAPDDTFGFGVVFSDETLTAFEAADPPTFAADHAQLRPLGGHRHPLPRRAVERSGGHGFSALEQAPPPEHPAGPGRRAGRRRAVHTPRRRRSPSCRAAHDLVIAADGINSRRARRRSPSTSGRRSTVASASSCGWAPTSSSRPSRSTSWRPSTASSRSTPTPTTRR